MTAIPPGSYDLDPAASSVSVRALHVGGVMPTTLDFPIVGGHGEVSADGATAEVHLATAGVTSGGGLRDRVLASGTWLAAKKHPEAVATISAYDGETGTGTLTVRGRTRPLTVTARDVQVDGDGLRMTVESRVNWRSFGVGTPGMVQPEVTVRMTLVARRS